MRTVIRYKINYQIGGLLERRMSGQRAGQLLVLRMVNFARRWMNYCSTFEILHDLSSNRREPGWCLSIINSQRHADVERKRQYNHISIFPEKT